MPVATGKIPLVLFAAFLAVSTDVPGALAEPGEPAKAVPADPPPLQLLLFASATCPGCNRIKQVTVPKLKEMHGERIAFRHIALDEIENFKLLLLYEKRYGVTDDEALKLFVGDAYLSGEKGITEGLGEAVAEQLAKGAVTPTAAEVRAEPTPVPSAPEGEDAAPAPAQEAPAADVAPEEPDVIVERFRGFKPATVAVAGLVDGINPCAFTTIVFFVSLLATLKKGKREILVVGICFALAVFGTYLALGIGALKAIKVLSVKSGISTGITVVVAVLAFVLAGYSFWDYAQYRRTGKAEDIRLKLPHSIRVRVNRIISTRMRTRNLAAGALTLGVVVSLLESLCTGQVYLPTIVYVMQDKRLAPQAIAWLVLYNGMFIVPLLVVFGLAYAGTASKTLVSLSRRHVGAAKLLLGLLFLCLGGVLLATIK